MLTAMSLRASGKPPVASGKLRELETSSSVHHHRRQHHHTTTTSSTLAAVKSIPRKCGEATVRASTAGRKKERERVR